MKTLFNNRLASLLLLISIAVSSCVKDNLTDGERFLLFYPDITDIGPSTSMSLDPTYHGAAPEDFKVYDVKYEGASVQTACFQIDAQTGRLSIVDSDGLAVGLYSISISCVSGGQSYLFPDMIKINMMKPVPDGVKVEPALIELRMSQVNNPASDEVLPTAQVTTDGNHITIKSYRIANVWCDGKKVEDWSGSFAINEETGLISVLKNVNFVAGTYVFDLKLITRVVSMESEEGLYANALTVDIVSPPVSLAYDPEVKRVEEGTGFVSLAPSYVASSKELAFAIKAVYPENVPLTIDPSTGVITLAQENGLKAGDKVQVSITMTNAFGTKDFDQVTRIDIVDFINPITKLSYEDATVWHGTAYTFRPSEVDGDDVIFSLMDLPEALAGLTIDEATGVISVEKGNKLPKGEHTFTVRVSNDKGFLTDAVMFNIVDNPYFFTTVSWGNNLGLAPVSDYASQHRLSVDEDTEIPVLKQYSDISEEGWNNVKFEIEKGSLPSVPRDASIDPATGLITAKPTAYIKGKAISFKRAHVAVIKVTVGEGTAGETVKRIPVFFDFNALRVDSGVPNAPEYYVEFTPFVFQCNPKKGGTFVSPTIKDKDGNPLSEDELANITMTYRRNAAYWNIDGPASHADGAPEVEGSLLNTLWKQSYQSVGQSTTSLANVIPVYSYPGNDKQVNQRLGYIQNDNGMKMYVIPDKWADADGYYADGIFTAQVTMGYKGKDGTVISADKAASPYQLFPYFIWFDTEF